MESNQGNFWESIRSLKKSAKDKKIAGVCGGLREHTPMPSWLWRAVFLSLTFLRGTGIIAYVALWICMPAADEQVNSQSN